MSEIRTFRANPVKSGMEKLYYSIGEVAEMFEVNSSLIRFWEKEFPVIKPKKNKKGNRLFTEKDIEVIRTIHQLVKVEGYTLEGAKGKLKSGVAPKGENESIIKKLELIRAKLESLKKQL